MSSPCLPPEIFDHIVDLLHGEPETLKACCLISKSWIPRTRKHLFASVEFRSVNAIESWKETFPDPLGSPAYHTRTLWVRHPEVVTVADAEEGGWIRTFSRVTKLVVHNNPVKTNNSEVTLIPFHGFSPVLESLEVFFDTLPNTRIFDLVSSMPLLKNLFLFINEVDTNDLLNSNAPLSIIQPPTSPAFTGTLDLTLPGGMGTTTRRLLALPNGLHFQRLALTWDLEEDLQWIVALVVGCSDTLKRLTVTCHLSGMLILLLHFTFLLPSLVGDSNLSPIDLSKATKLERVVFLPTPAGVEWITLSLQTVTPKHRDFRQILILPPYDSALADASTDVRQTVGDHVYGLWLDLDRLLVQLWESRCIRPMVPTTTQHTRRYMGCLLPEVMKRGMVE